LLPHLFYSAGIVWVAARGLICRSHRVLDLSDRLLGRNLPVLPKGLISVFASRNSPRRISLGVVAILAILGTMSCDGLAAAYDGILDITVKDEHSGQLIPARMELRNQRGRPVRVQAPGAVALDGYLVFDGEITLKLRRGNYEFFLEAGPEYETRVGHFTIDRRADDATEVVLKRHVNMREEGWWAGDLDVIRGGPQMPLLMRAASIDLASLVSQENLRGKCRQLPTEAPPEDELTTDLRIYGPWTTLDYRRGGGLLLVGDEPTSDLCQQQHEGSSLSLLAELDPAATFAVALDPFSWDLPLWVAENKLAAVQILHRHAMPTGAIDNEGWGRPRDKGLFPGALGNGRWSEHIYHHLLNAGVHIPPAAGSGTGANANPLGTNRTYVHCGDDFSREAWLAGLRDGRVMVTNGPLLRTSVSGEPPGHVFQLSPGETREFQVALSLTFHEQAAVDYLEIIKNGEVFHQVRLADLVQQGGRLPLLPFSESGWFLVRAVTANTENYQFAATAPYYVEAGYQSRISRESVEFFLTWLDEAAEEFQGNEAVLAEIEAARPFWQQRLEEANAE